MDIIKTVTDWPVIVQGALGSALFWAVLEVGQRIAKKTASRVTSDRWAANTFALVALEAEGEFATFSRFLCVYATLHYLAKAAVVTVLSFAISPAVDVFASVGYLIAIYFLFRALAFVPHTTSWGSLEDRKERFKQLVAETGKKNQSETQANSPKPPSGEL